MLIGIIGQKRSGKDTMANYLVEKYGFYKLAFADPIKEVAAILFNLDMIELHQDTLDKEKKMDEFNISLREFYQKFGTDIMQNDIYKYFPKMEDKIERKTFWVDNIFKKIKKMQMNGKENFVLSDVRFFHEADRIYKEGGILVKIYKDQDEYLADKHISENSIDEIPDNYITYHIDNNSTIKDYHNQIDNLFYI